MDLGYEAPQTRVFKAENADVLFLSLTLEAGKWYFAGADWSTFHGPYDSKEEADRNFQVYVKEQISCLDCGE